MRFNFTEDFAIPIDVRSQCLPRRSAVMVLLLLLVVSAASETAQQNEQANQFRIAPTRIANPLNNAREYFQTFITAPSDLSEAPASGVIMASQPQSYQLRCRGARTEREMQISIEKGRIEGFNKLVVGFKFGTRPAPRGLDPGQCSWIDRAMRQGEPLRLEENIPENSQSAADYLRSPGNIWTFYVYNTGKGYFQVTKSHFGQPMNY